MSQIANPIPVLAKPTIASDATAVSNSDEAVWTEMTALAQTVTVAAATDFVRLHVEASVLITVAGYIDVAYSIDAGAAVAFASPYAEPANASHRVSLKKQITGMSIGTHTIHVWFKRASGTSTPTAYFYGTAPGSPSESWIEQIH